MHGFLVVDKPEGITSHDVVARVRRLVGTRQVGHTGTLDPFATGVLVVACGAATKAIPYLHEDQKAYRAVLRLGETTDTQDCTGTLLQRRSVNVMDFEQLCSVAATMLGKSEQLPPMYSAVKQGGVPLYRLARKGQEVERAARPIEITELMVEDYTSPDAVISVVCSKGTYVRTLVHDLGERLGCGAHVRELRRTASGTFRLDQAVSLEQLQVLADQGQPLPFIDLGTALAHLPPVTLSMVLAEKVLNGLVSRGLLELMGKRVGMFQLHVPSGSLLAVASFTMEDDGITGRLLRVFPELCALQR